MIKSNHFGDKEKMNKLYENSGNERSRETRPISGEMDDSLPKFNLPIEHNCLLLLIHKTSQNSAPP